MINSTKAEVQLFGSKFEVTINVDCLTSVKNLNIGNYVKKAVTQEVCKLTGQHQLNISNFKRSEELIKSTLDEHNPRIEVKINKNKTTFLIIQYIGIQVRRDQKIKEIMK